MPFYIAQLKQLEHQHQVKGSFHNVDKANSTIFQKQASFSSVSIPALNTVTE